MSFPIHLISMLRMCGAVTVPTGLNTDFIINNLLAAVETDKDNHNLLGALQSLSGANFLIGPSQLPAIGAIRDMASPDVLGIIQHVTGLPIPVQGSPNFFIGQGSAAAGLGMMQPLLGALGQIIGFSPLQIGEFVSVAGQVIGQVSNFTQIGGGAAVAQLNNMQGTPITPGTVVTGMTSTYVDLMTGNTLPVTFSFSNYFDSRVATQEVYYPNINTISNALVTDSGEYIVIEDYITFYPSMNLTASVVTV